jgi:signal transduction histidine kinase
MTSRLPFRARLTILWLAALIGALLLFGGISYGFVRVAASKAHTDRLASAASAIRAIVLVRNGRVTLEASDRQQFTRILDSRTNGAVTDTYGNVLVSTVKPLPEYVASAIENSAGISGITIRQGKWNSEQIELALEPIDVGGRRCGVIAVWESLATYEQFLQIFLFALIVIGVGITLLALSIARVVMMRAMQPLTDLASLVSEIESHDLSERVGWGGADDELGRLCASFDRLLDRLQAVFQRQRRFVADASHELRGPLAVIRAETELALRKSRTAEEYRSALSTIGAEVEELTRLVDDLLAAARVESQGVTIGDVEIDRLVESVAARLKPLAAAREVTIRVASDGAHVVKGDAAHLERALFALLDNATRHADRPGFVDVIVSGANGNVRVSVADDGSGFSRDGLRYATDRFWRDDASRGTRRSGLGLAIVKGTVERFGGRIELDNAENGGARVTLVFA